MCSTYGHISSRDFVATDVPDVLSAEIQHKETVTQDHDFVVSAELKKACDGIDLLILCFDNDLEGESIGFEVIQCVRHRINPPPSGNIMDVVFRYVFKQLLNSQMLF